MGWAGDCEVGSCRSSVASRRRRRRFVMREWLKDRPIAVVGSVVLACVLSPFRTFAQTAQTSLAKNQTALTELDVAAAAADAFLTVLAAEESVRATRANVDRLHVFADNVRTLVQNQLRPGADQSRAEAELAVAMNQLSQAIQIADVARASLADTIGAAGTQVQLAAGSLAALPDVAIETIDLKTHPAARAGQAAVEVVRARERSLDRAYYPHIN